MISAVLISKFPGLHWLECPCFHIWPLIWHVSTQTPAALLFWAADSFFLPFHALLFFYLHWKDTSEELTVYKKTYNLFNPIIVHICFFLYKNKNYSVDSLFNYVYVSAMQVGDYLCQIPASQSNVSKLMRQIQTEKCSHHILCRWHI